MLPNGDAEVGANRQHVLPSMLRVRRLDGHRGRLALEVEAAGRKACQLVRPQARVDRYEVQQRPIRSGQVAKRWTGSGGVDQLAEFPYLQCPPLVTHVRLGVQQRQVKQAVI